MTNAKKALLVVSFGTSHNDTRKVTIEQIEKRLADAFPDRDFYKAWTSSKIIAIMEKSSGKHILNVGEALLKMKQDGITDVIIQPILILTGIEFNKLKSEIDKYRQHFEFLTVGNPLLSSDYDCEQVIKITVSELSPLRENQAVVLMGHGTTHSANNIYIKINDMMKDMNYSNFLLGTVEASPSFENVITEVKKSPVEDILLAPFMIVAGEHAKNDMVGDGDSWANRFRSEGYSVTPTLKSLGEMPGIQQIFVEHAKQCLK